MEELRENAGRTIIQSLKVGGAEFVIGENLDAAQQYVVWECNGEQYQLGHYCYSYEKAFAELLNRAGRENQFQADLLEQRGIVSKALTARDCIPDSKYEDYTNKLIVLDPSKLKVNYRKSEYQVLTAVSGFGCDPDSNGRRVYTRALFDGLEESFYRQDFLGVLDPSRYPAWVTEKLDEQTQAKNELENEDDEEMEL